MQATIVGIAFYFVLLWSLEGVGTLRAPLYGLNNFARSQDIHAIGRLLALSSANLMQVAAFTATLKLAVAVVFAWHIVQRALDHEMLEAGLMRINDVHLSLLAAAAMLTAIGRLTDRRVADDTLAGDAAAPLPQVSRRRALSLLWLMQKHETEEGSER